MKKIRMLLVIITAVTLLLPLANAQAGERALSIPEIVDVLDSFNRWSKEGDCGGRDLELAIGRYSSDQVRVVSEYRLRYGMKSDLDAIKLRILKVNGPVLKYTYTVNVCMDDGLDNNGKSCDSVKEITVEVVSKKLVKVTKEVLRGGFGAGTRTGDRCSCTFRKN